MSDIKKSEESKRFRCEDPKQRWLNIQQMIAWAEQNLPPEKRRNRPRVHRGTRR